MTEKTVGMRSSYRRNSFVSVHNTKRKIHISTCRQLIDNIICFCPYLHFHTFFFLKSLKKQIGIPENQSQNKKGKKSDKPTSINVFCNNRHSLKLLFCHTIDRKS